MVFDGVRLWYRTVIKCFPACHVQVNTHLLEKKKKKKADPKSADDVN